MNADTPWFYLFAYHSKMNRVNEKLQERFTTFIHKTIVYRKRDKRILKEEKPSIAGLIFVGGGKSAEIQEFLDENCPGIHLVKDYYTKKVVSIPHHVMLSFMKISQVDDGRIRFMPNSLGHYSAGHTQVTITSGMLSGLEGYIVRIARNRCLVTSIGNMTVAISGVHKESFENAEVYARMRKEMEDGAHADAVTLTPCQAEIDSCFFTPKDRLDVMVIARSMDKWIAKAKGLAAQGDFSSAIDMLVFILEETGSRILHRYECGDFNKIKDIVDSMCDEIFASLLDMEQDTRLTQELRERLEMERESLAMRFPCFAYCAD